MTVPRAEEELTKLTQNSMLSLVEAYAAGMETEIAEYQNSAQDLLLIRGDHDNVVGRKHIVGSVLDSPVKFVAQQWSLKRKCYIIFL